VERAFCLFPRGFGEAEAAEALVVEVAAGLEEGLVTGVGIAVGEDGGDHVTFGGTAHQEASSV
jgi:hypothetical protein